MKKYKWPAKVSSSVSGMCYRDAKKYRQVCSTSIDKHWYCDTTQNIAQHYLSVHFYMTETWTLLTTDMKLSASVQLIAWKDGLWKEIISWVCYETLLNFFLRLAARRRRMLWIQTWAADCTPDSPVLPRVRQRFHLGLWCDLSDPAECRQTADAGVTVWSLAGTHQSGSLYVWCWGTPVPTLCHAVSGADISTKCCLPYCLQGWGECNKQECKSTIIPWEC